MKSVILLFFAMTVAANTILVQAAEAKDTQKAPVDSPQPGLIVEEEMHNARKWKRVRITGAGVTKLCTALKLDIEKGTQGTIKSNDSVSCLVGPNGPLFGFIVGPKGEIVHLEHFGYD